ncbi:kinesin-like protein KIN-UC [Tanacetum coccineum]
MMVKSRIYIWRFLLKEVDAENSELKELTGRLNAPVAFAHNDLLFGNLMLNDNERHKKGRSLLMDDGVLTWLLANLNIASISTRRHIELALCHLAQNEDNTRDFVTSGVKELAKISVESSRDDIRDLAKKILRLNRSFKAELQLE